MNDCFINLTIFDFNSGRKSIILQTENDKPKRNAGLWFVVCCLWFVVCGLLFVVCGSLFLVLNLRRRFYIYRSIATTHDAKNLRKRLHIFKILIMKNSKL